MSTPPASYDRPPLNSGFRRSFTAPPRNLSFHERAGLDPSDSAADILYSHPFTRIVKFSPPFSEIRSASSPASSQDLDYPVDTIETLPWKTTTETTAASGLMRIEKVQGSTNFLKSGTNVMHAIMRNSQCWCVDGESRFVLRIRKFQYYRIELPTKTEEAKAKVEELKVVLKKILRFEVTPCPFKRGFHVELPESAITPRRKGTWKRRESLQASSPIGESPSPLIRKSRTYNPQEATKFGEKENERYDGESIIDGDEDEMESDSSDAEDDFGSSPPLALTPEPVIHNVDETEFEESEEESLVTNRAVPDSPRVIEEELLATNPAALDNSHIADEEVLFTESAVPDIPQIVEEDAIVRDALPDTEANMVENTETQAVYPESGEKVHWIADPIRFSKIAGGSETQLASPILDISSSDAFSNSTEDDTIDDDVVDNEVSPEGPAIEDDDKVSQDDEDIPLDLRLERQPTDTMSITSSVASFHSFASYHNSVSPPYPSPPASDDGRPLSPTPLAESRNPLATHVHNGHKRELSEMTITPSSPLLRPRSDRDVLKTERLPTSSELPSRTQLVRSAASDTSWPDIPTPGSYATNQLRHRLKARRSLSPLPPSSTVYIPAPQQERNNHIVAAILQKACSLAVGKPIEVAVMLIHILVRIAGGATVSDLMSGDLFKKPRQERDLQRKGGLPDQANGGKVDGTDEDDFGVPLRGRAKSTDLPREEDETDSLLDLD